MDEYNDYSILNILNRFRERLLILRDFHRSFWEEVLSEFRHMKARRLGCADCTHTGGDVPIILIHGHTGHKTNFNTFRTFLENANLGPIHVIQLENPWATVEEHAYQLKERVAQVVANQPHRRIKFIGASRGGIVAAHYTEYLSHQENVTVFSIVTMATPLKGTKVANYLPSNKLGPEELSFGSKQMHELRTKIYENDMTKYYHIATRTDYVIIPHDSAILGKYKDQELVVSGYSHNSILYCPKIADRVITWLKKEELDFKEDERDLA